MELQLVHQFEPFAFKATVCIALSYYDHYHLPRVFCIILMSLLFLGCRYFPRPKYRRNQNHLRRKTYYRSEFSASEYTFWSYFNGSIQPTA